jgi:hypothetical protein
MNLLDPFTLTAIISGAALLFVIWLYGMYRTAHKERDGFASATPASARLVKIGRSYGSGSTFRNSGNYGDVIVQLTFEVAPPSGPPYELTTEWSVEPASVSKLQEGQTFKIRIDAGNPKKIYSGETWAQAIGQEPIGPED